VTLPDGTEQAIYLRQVGPGRYAQDVLLPSDGPYEILVVLERDGKMYQAETGYVQEVPAEYSPPPATTEQVQGEELLRQIASMTGGELLDQDVELNASGDDDEAEAPPQDPFKEAWMWLLGAALVLWMLEIAVRRGIFVRDS
jgi:hypothetical protein